MLASAYAGWAGSLPVEIVEQRLRQTLQAADSPPDIRVAALIPTMFSGSPPAEPIEALEAIMLEIHSAGLRAMAHSLAEADLHDILPRITVPTLLLYGDQDVRAPLTIARDLHTRIPASTLVVMQGVGHMLSIEAADRFNAEIRSFTRSAQT